MTSSEVLCCRRPETYQVQPAEGVITYFNYVRDIILMRMVVFNLLYQNVSGAPIQMTGGLSACHLLTGSFAEQRYAMSH
jgi:hypothetical protein